MHQIRTNNILKSYRVPGPGWHWALGTEVKQLLLRQGVLACMDASEKRETRISLYRDVLVTNYTHMDISIFSSCCCSRMKNMIWYQNVLQILSYLLAYLFYVVFIGLKHVISHRFATALCYSGVY